MKKVVLLGVVNVVLSTAVLGQGQFYFNNRVGGEVSARFIYLTDPSDGSSSSVGSPDWIVQLLGGPAGTPVNQLVPLDPSSTTFKGPAGSSGAGYVVPVTVTVPGTTPGSLAMVVLRFRTSSGFCDIGPYSVTLGGEVIPPPSLPLGTSPIVVCIPEPSAVALALLALGGGLLYLRKPAGFFHWGSWRDRIK